MLREWFRSRALALEPGSRRAQSTPPLGFLAAGIALGDSLERVALENLPSKSEAEHLFQRGQQHVGRAQLAGGYHLVEQRKQVGLTNVRRSDVPEGREVRRANC